MKNLSSFLKSIVQSILNFFSLIISLYLSAVFFFILLADEAINGKENERLSEDFSSIVQKFSALPESLLSENNKGEELASN